MIKPNDVRVVWAPHFGSQSFALSCPANEILYHGPRGPGKCLPVGELVPTTSGWCAHGDLRAGDEVFGSDGRPIRVCEVFDKHERECFRIEFNDGSSITASDNHLWNVCYDNGEPRNWRTVETLEIVERSARGYPVRLPMRPALTRPYISLPDGFDCYMLGAWVGDGSASIRVRQPSGNRTVTRRGYTVEFGSLDRELVSYAESCGFRVKRSDGRFSWMTGLEVHKDALMAMELFGMKSETKFIPAQIMLGSVEQRVAFLQGLCDTDGTPATCGARVGTVSERLANDLMSLVRSLGGFCRRSVYVPKAHHRQKLPIFNIDFSIIGVTPFRLARKIKKFKKPTRIGWLYPRVERCVALGKMEVSCIRVDARDSLYVAGKDMLVTHNTDCQLMRFRRNVGVGYGAFWRGIIFDMEYRNLEDIVAKSLKWFPKFNDGAEFMRASKDYKWVWPTGEELLFRAGSTEADYNKLHGHEYCLASHERVITPFGPIAISLLTRNDYVLTPIGYKRVNRIFDVGFKECVRVNGQIQSIDHKVLFGSQWSNSSNDATIYDTNRGNINHAYNHPYNLSQTEHSTIPLSTVSIKREYCGMYHCFDIEVDDANCYITENGFVNKNCFIGFNELTKQPNRKFYDSVKSCNRSSFIPEINSPDPLNPLPDIPLEIFSTTNPHGPGHNWVKSYFIDAGAVGELVETVTEVLSPKTRKLTKVVTTKTHIYGHWVENGKLPEIYVAGLATITDENKRKAWFNGDWTISSGGAFDDIWDMRYIRKPRFKIPPQWKIDRAFDWGSTVPFYCGWFAEADGSEIEIPLPDGRSVWWGPVKGSIILFHEWFGGTDYLSNVGIRAGPNAVASGIAAREKILRRDGWIIPEVKPGPADNQIHNSMDADTDSIAKRMALPPFKIRWTQSDKTPGSRKNGYQLARDMIEASKSGDGPGLFIMDHCAAALNTLPLLQRDEKDPEDVSSAGVDHVWDALRYRILDKKQIYANSLDVDWYGTKD